MHRSGMLSQSEFAFELGSAGGTHLHAQFGVAGQCFQPVGYAPRIVLFDQ
jgi:hypothetical protein